MSEKRRTIDLTPTWSSVALVIAELTAHGNPDGRTELLKMARLADLYVAEHKGDKA